jgi:hypothetical protein
MRIPTVIVEGIPGSARHRPIENEFDPVDAGSHLPIRFDRRSKAAYLFCPFEPRSHIQQILDRDGFLFLVDVGNAPRVEDNLPVPLYQQAVEIAGCPQSTNLASSFESIPSSSGLDVRHSCVGQTDSGVAGVGVAPLQIAAAIANAPSAAAKKPNLWPCASCKRRSCSLTFISGPDSFL